MSLQEMGNRREFLNWDSRPGGDGARRFVLRASTEKTHAEEPNKELISRILPRKAKRDSDLSHRRNESPGYVRLQAGTETAAWKIVEFQEQPTFSSGR